MKRIDIGTAARALVDRLDDGPRECASKPDSKGRFAWHESFEALITELRDALEADEAMDIRDAA